MHCFALLPLESHLMVVTYKHIWQGHVKRRELQYYSVVKRPSRVDHNIVAWVMHCVLYYGIAVASDSLAWIIVHVPVHDWRMAGVIIAMVLVHGASHRSHYFFGDRKK